MDSINKNQPEDNLKNLQGQEAAQKMKELAQSAESCFFCTNITSGQPITSRPMAVLKTDDDGSFWFLTSDDSHKVEELERDPLVQLFFQGSKYSDFLTVHGTARLSKDKAKIKELWNPMLKVWFTEGEEDPRITVLQVIPTGGYYWDNKHGNAIAFVKQAVGAAIGVTLDDSVEGKLDVK
ncbi:pyridoxamine 5'-phosphate oxidase family protein [Rufibacter quisquiliarum]|uniref:General stress protein 26 n=1 Tax=Rufibacter quisquiliarum TaxID=1549639 RepID=A0A839GHR8_9BACT|nr:pyridoxamine 5'-phosphate oxidase family protein [Rufibacter quisquiliarum]MBA9078150.1 general stress protein 26 [Rufibacter quisquiliarum]